MSQITSVERLSYILKVVHKNNYPSIGEIIDYLFQKDLVPTERTIQRDLKTLRDMCHINIVYSRSKNGYYIDEESNLDFKEWMNVFELFNTAKIINETLLKSPRNLDFIDFDRSGLYVNDDIIKRVLTSVIEKTKVKFTHRSYWNPESKETELEPHLLKQYQNRWYVFGTTQKGEFRSFALDRISDLQTTDQLFKTRLKHPKKSFDDIVGLVYSESEIEEVILSFESFQGLYIKSQPIHVSQKIITDNDVELRVSLKVRPNYELEEQILKHGEKVTVIEPDWLRINIRNRLINAINKY